ncbi:unnamed protein product [Spirodela intermedia]|uniref:Uncharacterized protein n=1 Tax=Spirodela intermedia TaxID=51605 RepID=A0A7I8KRE8_SPIIN|nr:unnamed protein product [Spirodela intermedia]
MLSKKRRRVERPRSHPGNRYSEKPPDFELLASLYPSFQPFVFVSRSGRSTIDWTDFDATRELTRVLLQHDHGVQWWIPDGQLCPTVPNRSNYIHWIEDLLSSGIIPKRNNDDPDAKVRGFDIGTGANCIYPLLGASLLGWSFVAADVTDVALEWARKNVQDNPHLSHLIEIRNANGGSCSNELRTGSEGIADMKVEAPEDCYCGPPILVGVVREGEEFDFCMCNPPFFGSIEEAGLNPKTSCGGTPEEMVCPGGERAFITRIIEDSLALKHRFRKAWFTSMIGRKVNLKFLVSKLREVGVSIVKTTEFVQGRTARWGLAWSFMPPNIKSVSLPSSEKSSYSFMLQGLKGQNRAFQTLKTVESFFLACGSCRSDTSSFSVNVIMSNEQIVDLVQKNLCDSDLPTSVSTSIEHSSGDQNFSISVFEQIPGTLLVKGSLLDKESPFAGVFPWIFQLLEKTLRREIVPKLHGQ